jgi:hypothetical protein
MTPCTNWFKPIINRLVDRLGLTDYNRWSIAKFPPIPNTTEHCTLGKKILLSVFSLGAGCRPNWLATIAYTTLQAGYFQICVSQQWLLACRLTAYFEHLAFYSISYGEHLCTVESAYIYLLIKYCWYMKSIPLHHQTNFKIMKYLIDSNVY